MSTLGPLIQRPTENVVRGALFAAIVIPAGVVVWDVLWAIGIIASIVGFGIAFGAAWLYRKGAGGVVSVVGAFVISGIVVVTLLLSFWVGLLTDYLRYIADATGTGIFDALAYPEFWSYFAADFGALFEGNLLNFGMAVLFGALGAFSILRRAFTTATPVVPADPFATPTAGDPFAADRRHEPWTSNTDNAAGSNTDDGITAGNDASPWGGAVPPVAQAPSASTPDDAKPL